MNSFSRFSTADNGIDDTCVEIERQKNQSTLNSIETHEYTLVGVNAHMLARTSTQSQRQASEMTHSPFPYLRHYFLLFFVVQNGIGANYETLKMGATPRRYGEQTFVRHRARQKDFVHIDSSQTNWRRTENTIELRLDITLCLSILTRTLSCTLAHFEYSPSYKSLNTS